MDEDRLRSALKACLSDVDFSLERQGQVLNQVKGEKRMKKTMTLAVAFAMVMLLGSVALATSLGVFGSFTNDLMSEMSANRLGILDDVASEIGASVTLTAPGEKTGAAKPASDVQSVIAGQAGRTFTLTVDQAYSDGMKLYYSYMLKTEAPQTIMAEGKPAGIDEWDSFMPDVKFDEVYGFYDSNETAKIAGWLNGHDASYVIRETVSIGDGASMNGTPLNIYDSNFEWVNENTLTGFQEVRLPDAYKTGDKLNVQLNILYGATVYYQDETGVYSKYFAQSENRGILTADVTLPVNGTTKAVAGTIKTDAYTAEAKLYISDVDIYGTVTFSGVEKWLASDDPFDFTADAIKSYTLVSGVEELNNLDGALSGIVDGTYTIGVRYDLPVNTDNLILRPTGANDAAQDITIK